MNSTATAKKREPLTLNLLLNLLLPSLLMLKGEKYFGWSPKLSLGLALALPLGYGCYDFFVAKRANFFSIIGFVSLLLTGGIGLLSLPKEWIAIKEAAVPLVLGTLVLASAATPYPLVKKLLCNPDVLNMPLVYEQLQRQANQAAFDALLRRCTYLVSTSFLLSAGLNFILAKAIVHSESGTPAFTQEIGHMNLLTYPVIVLPCTLVMLFTVFFLVRGIKQLTGLPMESILKHKT